MTVKHGQFYCRVDQAKQAASLLSGGIHQAWPAATHMTTDKDCSPEKKSDVIAILLNVFDQIERDLPRIRRILEGKLIEIHDTGTQ